ncbi:MAG: DUF4292 domain-containing protein [Ferruginibacter sp.]
MKPVVLISLACLLAMFSCRPAKVINKAIAAKDSTVVTVPENNAPKKDSAGLDEDTRAILKNNYIDYRTFSAKIKVDVQAKDNVPELTANLRMIKDSVIWLSLQATFLNIEVYRVYITKDSVILLNKQDKEVQYRSLDYLQEVTQIPFDFKTLQDMLVGNPVFFDESNASVRKKEGEILINSVSNPFKNLLTYSAINPKLTHSKLDDVDQSRSRTASMSYDGYGNVDGRSFADKRQIIITEKNRIDIRLNFKQIEFNKELSVNFSVPKNYKKK